MRCRERIDAEVLLDAISSVTGVPEVFFRATGAGGKDPAGTRAILIKDTDSYPSHFLDMHGRPDRMMVPQRDGKANLNKPFICWRERHTLKRFQKKEAGLAA